MTPGVPVEQIRALVRLLWPDEITPTARRLLEQVCEEHDGNCPCGQQHCGHAFRDGEA